jgi:hypothetical protein
MLLWMDGFDTYGADGQDADAVMSGAGYTRAENLEMNSSTRTGRGMAVEMSSGAVSSQVGRIRRAIGTVNEVIVGFAVKVEGNDFFTVAQLIYDNLLGTAWTHLGVARNAQAGVSVYSYSGSTRVLVGASEPNVFFAGVWHYIEVKYKPGSYTVVRIDGATVLSTGGSFNAGAPQLVNMVQLTNPDFSVVGYKQWVDDFYICDTSGAIFNNFCGDVVVHALMPFDDALPNQMASFGGGLGHFTAVDDIPPDDDLSYLYSNTAGHTEMFGVDPLPANIIDVLAVSVHARAKKDAAGTSSIKLKCRYLTDTVESAVKPMTTQYTNKHHIFELAPDGGSWNKVKAAAMDIGVEIV